MEGIGVRIVSWDYVIDGGCWGGVYWCEEVGVGNFVVEIDLVYFWLDYYVYVFWVEWYYFVYIGEVDVDFWIRLVEVVFNWRVSFKRNYGDFVFVVYLGDGRYIFCCLRKDYGDGFFWGVGSRLVRVFVMF